MFAMWEYYSPTDGEIGEALAPFGVRPSNEMSERIREYIHILLQWNEKISLTAIVDVYEVLQRHFGESMFAALAVPVERGRLADVGSGGGFPALALRMIRPELQVALIESNGKKAAFLGEVVRRLGMSGVEVLKCRYEECSVADHSVDFVTSRAVEPGPKFLKWAYRKLTEHGRVVLWTVRGRVEGIGSVSGWVWDEPIGIPLSRSRVLLVGRALEH